MAKRPNINDLPDDLEAALNRDFNQLVKKVVKVLSTKPNNYDIGGSPVYTGFFASNWKAQNTSVIPKLKVEKYEPWASLKKEATRSFFKGLPSKPKNPVVRPRYLVRDNFKIGKTVYIGNTVEYAKYALKGGTVQKLVQGRLGPVIKTIMRDNLKGKGKILITKLDKIKYGKGSKTGESAITYSDKYDSFTSSLE
tara:strand:- start:3088 stop:3672 length:585 start_codon:yes stop_codon:yes gene_type:complete